MEKIIEFVIKSLIYRMSISIVVGYTAMFLIFAPLSNTLLYLEKASRESKNQNVSFSDIFRLDISENTLLYTVFALIIGEVFCSIGEVIIKSLTRLFEINDNENHYSINLDLFQVQEIHYLLSRMFAGLSLTMILFMLVFIDAYRDIVCVKEGKCPNIPEANSVYALLLSMFIAICIIIFYEIIQSVVIKASSIIKIKIIFFVFLFFSFPILSLFYVLPKMDVLSLRLIYFFVIFVILLSFLLSIYYKIEERKVSSILKKEVEKQSDLQK